jgi:hypothetical protein
MSLISQGGHHHVNEKPTDYWLKHLARFNVHLLQTDTARVRQLAAQNGAKYLAETGLVLVNRSR